MLLATNKKMVDYCPNVYCYHYQPCPIDHVRGTPSLAIKTLPNRERKAAFKTLCHIIEEHFSKAVENKLLFTTTSAAFYDILPWDIKACARCKTFVHDYGNLAVMEETQLRSPVWGMPLDKVPECYREFIQKANQRVETSEPKGILSMHDTLGPMLGTRQTKHGEFWHLAVTVPDTCRSYDQHTLLYADVYNDIEKVYEDVERVEEALGLNPWEIACRHLVTRRFEKRLFQAMYPVKFRKAFIFVHSLSAKELLIARRCLRSVKAFLAHFSFDESLFTVCRLRNY